MYIAIFFASICFREQCELTGLIFFGGTQLGWLMLSGILAQRYCVRHLVAVKCKYLRRDSCLSVFSLQAHEGVCLKQAARNLTKYLRFLLYLKVLKPEH